MSHSVLVEPGGKKESRDQSRAFLNAQGGAADQSNLLELKDLTQGQSSCLMCLIFQVIDRKKKKFRKVPGSLPLVSSSGQPLELCF